VLATDGSRNARGAPRIAQRDGRSTERALAHHLARQGDSSDLRLEQLWPAAGRRAPRYAVTAVMTTAAGALLASGVYAKRPSDALAVLGLGVFVVVTAWIAARPAVELRRLDLSSLRTSTGRKRIGLLLTVGLAAGLVGGLMLGGFAGMLMVTLQCGALGLVGGLMVGLGSGPTTRPTAIDRPSRLVQQGMVHTIAAIVAVTLTFLLADKLIGRGLSAEVVGQLVAGLGAALAVGLAVGLARGFAVGLSVGLNSATAAGPPFTVVALVVGLIFAANSPWPRYLFTALLLALQGDLPRRPAVFIDWAYQAGLMRLSGIAVQFRHREFQTWLANRDQPGDGPRPRLLTPDQRDTRTGNKE